jgi:hypothetical protein
MSLSYREVASYLPCASRDRPKRGGASRGGLLNSAGATLWEQAGGAPQGVTMATPWLDCPPLGM